MILSGVVAGATAGFLTNGVELLAVNKQADPSFSVRKYLMQRDALNQMFFKGVGFRTIYYGS